MEKSNLKVVGQQVLGKQVKNSQIRLIVCILSALTALLFGQTGTFDWTNSVLLYPGVQYAHYDAAPPDDPRIMLINCVRINRLTPNLRFYTTPRCSGWVLDTLEYIPQSTTKFITTSQSTNKKIVVAINANLYGYTTISALAVSDGVLVSAPGGNRWSFILSKTGVPSIVALPDVDYDISDVWIAVTGSSFSTPQRPVLLDGTPVPSGGSLNPRSSIGASEDGQYVFFMTIDGRITSSLGASLVEVGAYLKYFGAYIGINLDGGGSETMAWWNPVNEACELLMVPNESRAVANSIGIYFDEDSGSTSIKTTAANYGRSVSLVNTPNPFNPATTITYDAGGRSGKLQIFNSSGKLIYQSEVMGKGLFEWNAYDKPSGIYVCCLTAGNAVVSKKILLLK